jgi:hypothetical protein
MPQVGLLYIHDPQISPQQHADLAKKLTANFGGQLQMGVLKVHTPGGHQGDLLLVEGGSSSSDDGDGNAAAGAGDGAAGGAGKAEGAAQKEGKEQQQEKEEEGEEEEGEVQQQEEGGKEGGQQQQQQAKCQKLGEELTGAAEAPEGKVGTLVQYCMACNGNTCLPLDVTVPVSSSSSS